LAVVDFGWFYLVQHGGKAQHGKSEEVPVLQALP
jgi:hypothetical protein